MCGVDPTTRASNLTKRTLMTNAPTGQYCGHRFCGACVERGSQASKGQGSFPGARRRLRAPPVRRATLDPRRLDAIEVARDASARARTLAVHNKPRDAFATRRDYDDYLEERENVVHALTYGAPAPTPPRRSSKRKRSGRRRTSRARRRRRPTPRGVPHADSRRRRPAADRGARGAAARVAAAAEGRARPRPRPRRPTRSATATTRRSASGDAGRPVAPARRPAQE